MNDIFAKEVKEGLTSSNKFLSSKYFYDDLGSRIFQEIMEMPEYYLTDCEYEIFKNQSAEIYEELHFKEQHFNLIELGAGDGAKTTEIIRYLTRNNILFTYIPIDISQEANNLLSAKLMVEFPNLKIAPLTGDYFEILKSLKTNTDPSLLLFIGSNIGNYKEKEAKELLNLFHQSMQIGDKIIIGVDLKKNPLIIHNAYFDPHGITKRFNLNLLNRINRELQANFKIKQFDFYINYTPETGELKSYIVSLVKQSVHLSAIDLTVSFDEGETIWTELSKKYAQKELENLIQPIGFKIIKHFTDNKKYFTDSLFIKQ